VVGWIDPDGKKRSKLVGCRSLAEKFARIQTAAGNDLPCHEQYERTDACHRYRMRRRRSQENAVRRSWFVRKG
jgi:hypothetical protein